MGTGTAGATGSATMTGNAARPLLPSALDLRRVPTAGDYDLAVNVQAPGHAADSLPRTPKKAKSPSKTSHGYIGVLGAPDFSTVKYQAIKGVGTTFGLLLGYSFNDRWAVESGVYLDRKRYYTEGEYFNTKNVSTNYNTLLNVDGTCNMWEIPLNVRYNFNTNERMKWFATAGLSTYLMSNENYAYQDQPWPGGPVTDGYWKIKKPSQYLFSVVNLSAGFEQRIGKIGNLRLEPYVRLPLSGIGTGRLPIMSAGLNIGFTRRLW
jgi:opacity protein-like surface antigen